MQITQEEIVDRQVVLLIELDDDDVNPYLDRGYRRLVQQMNIPGFRKGKAPRAIVERFVGRESLIQESIEDMVPDVTRKAIEAQELDSAGMPKLEIQDLEPVTIKATVPLKPTVDLGDYASIRVEEPEVEVKEDDADQRLEDLRTEASTWVPVERAVQLGDMVTMNVKGSVDGKTIIDQEDAIHVAEEGSVVPLPGFSAKLVGAKLNEAQEFELSVADDHPDTTLAGQEAKFTVTVTEIKERQLPDLDDEFAHGVKEGFDSLADLKADIEKTISEEATNARDTQFREAAIDKLLQQATIEIPPLIIDHEIEHMVERRDRFVQQLNMQLSDYLKITGKTEEETVQEMREHATERLSRSWALNKLSEVEEIDVSQEEIDKRVQELADSSEDPSKILENEDIHSDEVSDSLRQTMLVEKAMEKLTELVSAEPATTKTEPEKQITSSTGGTEDDD